MTFLEMFIQFIVIFFNCLAYSLNFDLQTTAAPCQKNVKKYKPFFFTCLQVFYLTFIKDEQDGEGRRGGGRGGEAPAELQTDSRMSRSTVRTRMKWQILL
jgi:hypothetical protein